MRRGLLLGLCLLLAGPLPAEPDERATRAQLRELQQQLTRLNRQLERARGERSEVESALRKAEQAIGALQPRIDETTRAKAREEAELKKLQARRAELESARAQQQRRIGYQVRAAHQLGRERKLKLLLNQEAPETLSRSLAYYDYFNRARIREIEAYRSLLVEIDKVEPAIAERTAALEARARELEGQRRDMVAAKEERSRQLARLNTEIRDGDAEYKALERDRRELERLLSAMQETLANLQLPASARPFAEMRGQMPWPVEGGRASNSFGSRREGGDMRWQGINIRASEGAGVRAIHHGRVVFSDWLRGYGLLVILDHGDGYMSLYGHNQSLLRETGAWVSAGEVIATVGNSGGREQASLYFEIRHNGQPADPVRWCRRG